MKQVIRTMFGLVGAAGVLVVLVGVVLLARSLAPDAVRDDQPDRSQIGVEQPGHMAPGPTPDKGELPVHEEPPSPPGLGSPLALRISVSLAPTLRTPAQIAQTHGLVVLGRVVEILPPQWTTPDGQCPAEPWRDGVVPH